MTAPSAMRVPISTVRCLTKYETTPYIPSVAMNSAARPKNVIITELKRSSCSVSRRTSFIMLTSRIASVGSVCRMARRAAAIS